MRSRLGLRCALTGRYGDRGLQTAKVKMVLGERRNGRQSQGEEIVNREKYVVAGRIGRW